MTLSSPTPRRFTRAAAGLAVAAVALTGCNVAKAGTKCSTGAAPARDATHVLLCQKGRWTKSLTLGQAADIITSTWPAKVEVTSGATQSAAADATFKEIVVKVTKRDGAVLAATEVTLAGPSSGATLAAPITAKTDANGLAKFTPKAGTVAGTFDATFTAAGGTKPMATTKLTVTPAEPTVIAQVSGDNQVTNVASAYAQPLVVKVTDRFGNAVVGSAVTFVSRLDVSTFTSSAATTDAAGRASTGVWAGNDPEVDFVTATTTASANVHFGLSAGAPVDVPAERVSLVSGDGQVASATKTFGEPLVVRLLGAGATPLVGKSVKFEVIADGPTGGTVSAATATTDASGNASVTALGNGRAGRFTVRATYGTSAVVFQLTNP